MEAWLPPMVRAFDVGLAVWLLSLCALVLVALTRVDSRDRLTMVLLTAAAFVLRVMLAAAPANFYLPVSAQGPLGPDVFHGSYPVVSDALVRLTLWFGGSDGAYFSLQLLLGLSVAPLCFLAARGSGQPWRRSVLWSALLCAAPLAVWLSRSDAPHVLVLTLAASAVLAMSVRVRLLSSIVALMSLWLAFGVRLELLPGLAALALLADALRVESKPGRVAPFVFVAVAAIAAAVTFGTTVWLPALDLAEGMRPDAEPALSVLPLFLGAQPGLSSSFLWIVVAPFGLAGLARLARRDFRHGTWQCILGLALATLPSWSNGVGADDFLRGRYLVMALPFGALLVCLGVEHLASLRLRSRWLWAALAVLAIAPFVTASLRLHNPTIPWQAEYDFLAEGLDELPLGGEICLAPADPDPTYDAGVEIVPLALPHPLLVLRRPDVGWRRLEGNEGSNCDVLYAGLSNVDAQLVTRGQPLRERRLGRELGVVEADIRLRWWTTVGDRR